MPERTGAPAQQTPGALRVAVGVLAAETAGLVALSIFLIYEDLAAPAATAGGAFGVTLYAVVMTALMALLSWALWRRQRWARGPAIVVQLLLLPIGYYLIAGGVGWLGIPTMAAGVVGAGALLAPATRSALGVH